VNLEITAYKKLKTDPLAVGFAIGSTLSKQPNKDSVSQPPSISETTNYRT
jgi:hypothetical protein